MEVVWRTLLSASYNMTTWHHNKGNQDLYLHHQENLSVA